jgi:hypothetical protein
MARADRPKLAHTSWFDANIVTQQGEDLLMGFDNAGLIVLQKSGLVGPAVPSIPNIALVPLSREDFLALRRFLLSVHWRAAISGLPQFSEVQLEKEDLNTLREYLLGKADLHQTDFPISILRFADLKTEFNTSPYLDIVKTQNKLTEQWFELHRINYYFSGLQVMIGLRRTDSIQFSALSSRALRGDLPLRVDILPANRIEESLYEEQAKNILKWRDLVSRMVK